MYPIERVCWEYRGPVYNGRGMLISAEDLIKQWKEHFILKNNVKMIWSHLRKYFI